jgi:hypothetical protein
VMGAALVFAPVLIPVRPVPMLGAPGGTATDTEALPVPVADWLKCSTRHMPPP